MSKIIIPANYTPALNLYDTQRAIGKVKRLFAGSPGHSAPHPRPPAPPAVFCGFHRPERRSERRGAQR